MSGSSPAIRDTARGALFRIRVVPGASRSETAGFEGETLKLRITEAPVEGRANDACMGLLARMLGRGVRMAPRSPLCGSGIIDLPEPLVL